jgi:hypothetical protein
MSFLEFNCFQDYADRLLLNLKYIHNANTENNEDGNDDNVIQLNIKNINNSNIEIAKTTKNKPTKQQDLSFIRNLHHHHYNNDKIHNENTLALQKTDVFSTYYDPLKNTFENYIQFINKLAKTLNTIDQTLKSKRLAIMMEQNTKQNSVKSFFKLKIFYPDSKFRLIWNILIILIIFYYNTNIPLRIMMQYNCENYSYPRDTLDINSEISKKCLSKWNFTLILDYLFDFILLIDLIFCSFYFLNYDIYNTDSGTNKSENNDSTNNINEDNLNWRIIYNKFKKTFKFYLLVLICIPIDFIALSIGYILLFRCLKLLSILLLPVQIENIQIWLDKVANINISSEASTVLHLALDTIFVTIWISVGWSVLHFNGDSNYFVSSFYWCFTTMTTTGYGDIVPDSTLDTVYTVFVIYIGPVFFATIIGKFASYVKKFFFFFFIFLLNFSIFFQ